MYRWLPLLGALVSCASRPHVVRLDIGYDTPRHTAPTTAVTQSWHEGGYRTRAIAVSPGGGLVATGYHDVRLWDVTAGRLRAVLDEDFSAAEVTGLAFEYDPHRLVIVREDGGVDRWDLRTNESGSLLEALGEPVVDHDANVGGLGPHGVVLGSVFADWTRWQTYGRYKGRRVVSVAHADGTSRWAVADEQGAIYFGDPEGMLRTVVEPRERIARDWRLAMSDSGQLLAAARGGGVIVWKADEWRPRTRGWLMGMDVHAEQSGGLRGDAEIMAMRFFDEELVTVDSGGGVTLIDHDGDVHELVASDLSEIDLMLAAFSGRGPTLGFVGHDGRIGTRSLLRGDRDPWQARAMDVPGRPQWFHAVGVAPTGDRLVIVRSTTLETWDLRTRRRQPLEVELPWGIEDVRLSEDGTTAHLRGGDDAMLELPLGTSMAEPSDPWPTGPEPQPRPAWAERASAYDVSDDGTFAVAVLSSYEHGAPDRVVLRSFDGKRRLTRAMAVKLAGVAVSPDGYVVAVVDDREGVWMLDAASLRLMSSFSGDEGLRSPPWRNDGRIVEYGPDGTLAFVRDSGELVLVDLDDGERETVMLGGSISDLAFAPEGRWLAAVGQGGPWLVGSDDEGRRRSLVLVPDGREAFGVMRPDGVHGGRMGASAPRVRVGTVEAGTLLGSDHAPAALRRDELLAEFLAGRPWPEAPDPIVPAEVRLDWVFGHGRRFSIDVDVLPGTLAVHEVCIEIDTVAPDNTHTVCLGGPTRREITLRGRPDVVRARACEAGGICRQAVVEQWDVSGEELLALVGD